VLPFVHLGFRGIPLEVHTPSIALHL
jgi:hypothetical protein